MSDAQPTADLQLTDPLDPAIKANRGYGHYHYTEVLEIIRDRLRALEAHRDPSFHGVAWLIECSYDGSRPDYYCSPAVWCNNPFHAHKFKTQKEAEAVSSKMTTIGERRVTEHSWE